MRIKVNKPRLSITDTRTVKPPPKVKAQVYYGVEYQRWRDAVIARAGGRCQAPDCKTPDRGYGGRLYADHLVEIRDGGAAHDVTNGGAKCPSCHTRKTAAARLQRYIVE